MKYTLQNVGFIMIKEKSFSGYEEAFSLSFFNSFYNLFKYSEKICKGYYAPNTSAIFLPISAGESTT